MKNGFTLRSLVIQLSLSTILAGFLYAAIPGEHSEQVLQDGAANQVAGTPSRGASPSTGLPQSRGPQDPRPAPHQETQRVRKWTGSLVDADCMSKALRRVPGTDQALFPDPLSEFWQTLQSSQRAEQERNSGAWSP